MSDLWVCMRDVISEFNSKNEGSHASWALMLFLCSILCLICSGSSLHVECNLPLGMLCLPTWIMMFVMCVYLIRVPLFYALFPYIVERHEVIQRAGMCRLGAL